MHAFTELIYSCTSFTLSTLKDVEDRTVGELQTSGATVLVKTLQTIQLQRAVSAVGMFSLFEAWLQDGLNCDDGFGEAKRILKRDGQITLLETFSDYQAAINVLKHGRGRSYDALVAKANRLAFKIMLPGHTSFNEGDVSEVNTLVEVDDAFVLECAQTIQDVSSAISKSRLTVTL